MHGYAGNAIHIRLYSNFIRDEFRRLRHRLTLMPQTLQLRKLEEETEEILPLPLLACDAGAGKAVIVHPHLRA